MSEEKLNLYQKILGVMRDVEYLQKDDNVSTGQGRPSYKAISEEKVTMAVRTGLVKYGLVIMPIEQEHVREPVIKEGEVKGFLTTVNVKYKIVDTETGEYEIITSSGTGVDTQDKGVGKAMTYSYKYLLLRTFSIPTGEDPDKVSSAEWDEKFNQKQEEQKKDAQTHEQKASNKQLDLINKLLNEVAKAHDITPQEAYETLKKRMNVTINLEEFTSKQASQAISILNEAKKATA